MSEPNQDATLGIPSISSAPVSTSSAPATPVSSTVKPAAVTTAPATPTTSTDTPAPVTPSTIKIRERREVREYPSYITTPLIQTRVIEAPAGTALENGAVEVPSDTPVSGWANEGGV